MNFIHIPPEVWDKHPWVGVLIGLLGVAAFTFISYDAARNTFDFSRQRSPEILDVDKLEQDHLLGRRWVTITNFYLDCATIEKTANLDVVGRLVSGPVDGTYVIVKDISGNGLAVAQFNGDIFCPNFQGKPLTGVLTTIDDVGYGLGYSRTQLSKTTPIRLILHVGEGLGNSINLLGMGMIFDIIFLSLALKYSRSWLQKRESLVVEVSRSHFPNRCGAGSSCSQVHERSIFQRPASS